MGEELENLIRQWARSGPVPGAPAPPTESCLTFAQAARISLGHAPPPAELADHLAQCGRCRQLLADFAEALDEGPAQAWASGAPEKQRIIRLLTPGRLAWAASVLLAVGLAAFLAVRHGRSGGTILAAADVGLASDVHAGVFTKAGRVYRSGETIMFRVESRRDGYVALINLDATGRLTAHRPDVNLPDLVRPLAKGTVTLGPYRLDDTVGDEVWFVVATARPITDLADRVRRLGSGHDPAKGADKTALTGKIGSWPADVRVVSFRHARPTE